MVHLIIGLLLGIIIGALGLITIALVVTGDD